MEVRILLADDHAVLRAGLRALLDPQQDYTVVGEAANGMQVIALAETVQPDLILLDLSMPGLGGLDVLPTLKKVSPQSKVLILTMHEDVQYLRQALKRGAAGYVLKKAADVELLTAIQAVMRGEVYVHPAMTRPLLGDAIGADDSQGQEADRWELLSDREQAVLRLVALGHTSAEIAAQLSISSKTVDTYRSRGMEKLGLKTRAALVRFTLKRGLLTSD